MLVSLRFALSILCFGTVCFGATNPLPNRWSLDGEGGIVWTPKSGEIHDDNIEMSGLRVSVIVTYGLDQAGHLSISRQVIWPMLRFMPVSTRAHLALTFGEDAAPRIFFDSAAPRNEAVTRISHREGVMRVEGTYGRDKEIAFTRTIFPSVDKPCVMDRTEFTNHSAKDVVVEIEDNERRVDTNPARGVYGGYVASAQIVGPGARTLKPGERTAFTLLLAARKTTEPNFELEVDREEQNRRERVGRVLAEMRLETPDPVLNTAFAFAKIRATESIYATRGGLMHGPGGGAYYAAIWANDQAEYANPFFAMLADPTARESALNAYRHFARFMNADYQPIPSSIIAEGVSTWHGAKDRGDMAMIAYGAARFALAAGDRHAAEELWPLIAWCLEYCRRHVTADGVVASDSDELENRFPSGKANLCTSSLYYDALVSAAFLARELGQPPTLSVDFEARAPAVRAAIDRYFGARVEGFETYRYFDKSFPSYQARHAHYANEPDHLRAWICVPLTVGITDRAAATIDALFSPRLWTPDGLATEAGKETFWDRATLYALRGVFAAGESQRALDFLTYYSNRRLLGEHVPYPVEAYPEGNQRHLSAESALYCRIFTEGMFGLRPTGLHSFALTPRLPAGWAKMTLKNVHAFGSTFDLTVSSAGNQLHVEVAPTGGPAIVHGLKPGESVSIALAGSK
jgi:hypothetical protein